MTNNNEASFPVEISYGKRSGYTIQGLNDSDSFLLAKMKLIYPTSIYKPKVAPHIDLVQDITMKTNQLNPENVETFLHDILLSSLDRQYMDPNLKLNFLKNISSLWSTSFPAAPISDYLGKTSDQAVRLLPFDYNWLRLSPCMKTSRLCWQRPEENPRPPLRAGHHLPPQCAADGYRPESAAGGLFPPS